jgi:hypothetical protein
VGWYTRGPGDLEYKYGDVFGLARACGLGRLEIVPRVRVIAGGDEVAVDDLEFVGPLQRAIERTWLPWVPFRFDAGGEAVEVPRDRDAGAELDELAHLVESYADSIARVYEAAGVDKPIEELIASFDASWTLPAADVPALLAWLNAPLDGGPITLAALREGQADDGWYEPPADLQDAFDTLEGDEPRHLALHAVAWAALAGGDDDLVLDQPDDEHQQDAWTAGEAAPGVLLFHPDVHPFMGALAEAFDLPAAEREWAFSVHGRGHRPAAPAAAPEVAAFAAYAARLLAHLFGRAAGLPREVEAGWHPDASELELADGFRAADLEAHHLGDLLDDARIRVPGLPVPELLARRSEVTPANRLVDYLRDGGEVPAATRVAEVGDLLLVVGDLDLPAQHHDRLTRLLRAAVTAT